MAEMENQTPEPPKPNPSSGAQDGPKGKKSDKATVALRVEEIYELRLKGVQFSGIVRFGTQKGWGVSERMIQKYIRKADALLVERLDKNRKTVLARHIAQRQALFNLALDVAGSSGDCRAALAILADEAKLRGLYPDTKEVKDLVKLAESLGLKVADLERRLANASGPPESETSPPGSTGPESGPEGSRPPGRQDNSVPE